MGGSLVPCEPARPRQDQSKPKAPRWAKGSLDVDANVNCLGVINQPFCKRNFRTTPFLVGADFFGGWLIGLMGCVHCPSFWVWHGGGVQMTWGMAWNASLVTHPELMIV